MMPKLRASRSFQDQNQFPDTPVIILTGMDQITTAVSCVKNGASTSSSKPEMPDASCGDQTGIRLHELQMETGVDLRIPERHVMVTSVYGNFASRSTRMIRIVRFLEPLPPCQHHPLCREPAPARENLQQFCTDLDVSKSDG